MFMAKYPVQAWPALETHVVSCSGQSYQTFSGRNLRFFVKARGFVPGKINYDSKKVYKISPSS